MTSVGTAFAIASAGLFLTARHVFDEFLNDHAEATDTGQAGLYIYWETARALPSTAAEPDVPAALGGFLPVIGTSWHPSADVGLLRVSVPQLSIPVTFPTLALHVGLPKVGQRCAAVAYDEVRIDGQIPVGARASVDVRRRLAVTRGLIEDLHPERRDNRLNWPCFLTDARYLGGMSGGPVLSDDGRVVGAVCSGASRLAGETWPEISYATLLAAALPLPLPPGPKDEPPMIVADLIESGVVSVTGMEEVDVIKDGDHFRLVYVVPP